MIQQKYVLNMVPGGSPVRVHVSQYDEDSRELVFGLYSGSGSGPAFTVPDGAVVTCDGTKPDGKGFSVLADHNGDTVTVTVTKQMTAVCGETRCQLTVNKDGAVLGSANFVLIAERGALDADADMSESEYSVFEDLRNQTATNAQIAQAAADEINAAQDELAAAITAAGTAKSGLETATQDAGAANTRLNTATSAANTAHGNLQEATTAALAANDALVQPTADAQVAKTALDAANQTAQDNLAALQDADAMAQKIPLVQGAAAGNVPLLNADGSLQDSGKPLTPAGIGSAPAGYGLGEQTGKIINDPNTVILPGFYGLNGGNSINVPEDAYAYIRYGTLLVERRYNYIAQTAEYNGYRVHRYSIDSGGTWGDWEWENPPMAPGVEYRTTERYDGKVIYTRLLNIGKKADGKTLSIDGYNYVRYSATWGNNPLPLNDGSASFYFYIEVNGAGNYVKMHTSGIGESDAETYLQLWFTK